MRFCALSLLLLLPSTAPARQQDFSALAQAAQKAQEAGDNAAALDDYTRALALKPGWREGLWGVGAIDYSLDRYADAIPPLAKLASLQPDSGAAFSLLGLSEFETGALTDARTHLEHAYELHNTGDASIDRIASYHLALLRIRAGEFDSALTLLHLTFSGTNPPEQAREAMGLALLRVPLLPRELSPAHEALVLAAGGAAAQMAEGDAHAAAAALAALLAESPQAPGLHAAYAHALEAAGESARAAPVRESEQSDAAGWYGSTKPADPHPATNDDAAWQQAMQAYSSRDYPRTLSLLRGWVESHPEDGTAWAVIGLAEYAQHEDDNALLHLERGRRLGVHAGREASEFALFRLALLLNRAGRFDEAMGILGPLNNSPQPPQELPIAFGLALLHRPALPDQVPPAQQPLIEEAGGIAALLVASRYDEAFPRFRKLLAAHPDTPWLHYAYGTALESLSQFDEAAAQMREETKLSPASAQPWTALASIALKQHQPADALTAAQKAVALAPASADAVYEFGRAQLESGDAQAAAASLERAVRLAPQSPEPHFALARAYARLGDTTKAAAERAEFARLHALAEEQQRR